MDGVRNRIIVRELRRTDLTSRCLDDADLDLIPVRRYRDHSADNSERERVKEANYQASGKEPVRDSER